MIRVLHEWGLENRVVAFTTDNASNITKAVELCNWRHIRCFAHSPIIVVQNVLNWIEQVKEKVGGIGSNFKRSSQAAWKLKSVQE